MAKIGSSNKFKNNVVKLSSKKRKNKLLPIFIGLNFCVTIIALLKSYNFI
jgi:hypothetical protein